MFPPTPSLLCMKVALADKNKDKRQKKKGSRSQIVYKMFNAVQIEKCAEVDVK